MIPFAVRVEINPFDTAMLLVVIVDALRVDAAIMGAFIVLPVRVEVMREDVRMVLPSMDEKVVVGTNSEDTISVEGFTLPPSKEDANKVDAEKEVIDMVLP